MEVLAEQKVPCFQTMAEADPTIALLANLLTQCHILSSDSDFYIFTGSKPIPLNTLKFAKAARGKKGYLAGDNPKNISEKVWTLQGECISLSEICKKEFRLNSPDMLALAAVLLGNDDVPPEVMKDLKNLRADGTSLKIRITKMFEQLSRYPNADAAIRALSLRLSPESRANFMILAQRNMRSYNGEGGEKAVWMKIKGSMELSNWIDKAFEEKRFPEKDDDPISFDFKKLNEFECLKKHSGAIRHLLDKAIEEQKEIAGSMDRVPNWFKDKHISCELQTYLLNIVKNEVVFLNPQVEMFGFPSTHDLSIPIIRVTAGILTGIENCGQIELVSANRGKVNRVFVSPLTEISFYGVVPLLVKYNERNDPFDFKSTKDFGQVMTHESRTSLILGALGIQEKTGELKFYEGWPLSYKIWIATLMYFIKKKLYTPDQNREPIKCLAVLTSIFLCIIKNLIVNPGKQTAVPGNKCLTAIHALHKATSDPKKLLSIRKFFEKYEDFSKVSANSKFLKTYDISISYAISQYFCILYHTEMLNNLLCNPFRSPKIRYTMNNFFVYNFADYIINELEKRDPDDRVFNDVIAEATGVFEINEVLYEFLGVCYDINKVMPESENPLPKIFIV